MTDPTPTRARPTARVLVFDPAGRVPLSAHDGELRAWTSRLVGTP